MRVEDASGAQFELYEVLVRRWLRQVRIFELETGEPARVVDDNTFALVRTGERLTRAGLSSGVEIERLSGPRPAE